MYFPTDLDQIWDMYFPFPRNKYWRDFISKNQPLGQMGEGVGLKQNHVFSDGSGPNLAQVFFISRKKILAWFHIEKSTPRVNGGRGNIDAKSCIFRRIWTKYVICIFHPLEINTDVISYRNPTPRAIGGRGGFDEKSCIFRRIWTKFGICIFHPPEINTGVFSYRKTNP